MQWNALSVNEKVLLVAATVLSLLVAADLYFVGTAQRFGSSLVTAAYQGQAPALLQRVFSRIATDAFKTPVEAYQRIYQTLFVNLRLTVAVILVLANLIAVGRALPAVGERLGISRKALGHPAFMAAAVLLGCTASIRQLGAFAGVLVSLYAINRWRSRAVFPLLIYWVIAAVVMVTAWPYLWPDPAGRFIGSVLHAADFPVHTTLFRGRDVGSNALPWDYFPTLSGLQLTEPAILLVVLGSAIAIRKLASGEGRTALIGLLVLWAVVPALALALRAVPAYGLRHLLFVFPALFVFAGLAFETVKSRLRPPWVQALVAVGLILPGIWGSIQLHPYEYIYFNSLAGGVGGADGEYELDRWCISYREAAMAVNQIAEPGATVGVPTQTNQLVPFLRPDLLLVSEIERVENADIVISCVWQSEGDWHTQAFERVVSVSRVSAVLTEVWQRRVETGG